MIKCIVSCFAKLPWWAWVIFAVVAIFIAVLTYFTGGAIVIAGVVTIPLWLVAIISGIGAGLAPQLIICFNECSKNAR